MHSRHFMFLASGRRRSNCRHIHLASRAEANVMSPRRGARAGVVAEVLRRYHRDARGWATAAAARCSSVSRPCAPPRGSQREGQPLASAAPRRVALRLRSPWIRAGPSSLPGPAPAEGRHLEVKSRRCMRLTLQEALSARRSLSAAQKSGCDDGGAGMRFREAVCPL